MTFYVYKLIDPRDGLPFYIGKGTGMRANTHLWDVPASNKTFRCFDWELDIGAINVPDGFTRGRGPISK